MPQMQTYEVAPAGMPEPMMMPKMEPAPCVGSGWGALLMLFVCAVMGREMEPAPCVGSVVAVCVCCDGITGNALPRSLTLVQAPSDCADSPRPGPSDCETFMSSL